MSNVGRVKTIIQGMMQGTDTGFKDLVSDDLLVFSPVMDEISVQESPSKTLVEVLGYWKKAFPGVKSHWTNVDEDSQGNVVVNWEASAVHTGDDFMGIPAQNTPFTYSGTTTYTFRDGKLVQYRADVNLDTIIHQLK